MKILIAPNAFKGTIEADEAVEIISKALLEKHPCFVTECLPIADGGDGTCYLLGKVLGLQPTYIWTMNPIGRSQQGFYFLDPNTKTAYLDVSTVSGIKYLNETEKNPWVSSTYGTGELIRHAVGAGANHIVLGLGGSATVDLGLGILSALGFSFLDESGREIPKFGDTFLQKIKHIQRPVQSYPLSFTLLCDVNNTFFGEEGAIPVFGPQKGLKHYDFEAFHLACQEILLAFSKKTGKAIPDQEGFGAAGGIAYGLSFFYETQLKMGAKWFFDKVGMEEKVKWADWVITGEGKYDGQSAGGKGSYELMQLCRKYGKNCALITSGKGLEGAGFQEVIYLPDLDFSQKDFKEKAKDNLRNAVLDFKLR
ncbi:glycerate kinase [Cecembia calidifontis]|jgi:glycerate kinase|uniref:Glycerate kinase n=1 Tax=Cecembia calidifontis TaxID=1187080 RepID=A0A4V2F6S8_9BACT|nr:glycerate kinase [Cecembia calidifontis]RZS97369.1 glycerate kinase [Cecembia calidifontis]